MLSLWNLCEHGFNAAATNTAVATTSEISAIPVVTTNAVRLLLPMYNCEFHY